MTREDAISTIEALYPADADGGTGEKGRELLAQAQANVAGWRTEPDAVLFEYARLCSAYEMAECRRVERSHRDRW